MKRVAIVGRPNVGKSALFNRLAGRKIAIVHDQPGVTRDRLVAISRLGKTPFEIIDTGGIGAEPDPDFAEPVRLGAIAAIETADIILFVTDAKDGLLPIDKDLAKLLRKTEKPVLLVANKIDSPQNQFLTSEFEAIGFPVFAISAEHGHGIPRLIEEIESLLGRIHTSNPTAPSIPNQHQIRIAIVGRPNTGKSSLLNALVGEERAIVSEIPGTTRDLVETPFTFNNKHYLLCDTAGLRHRSRHKTSVEVFSAIRTEKAIEIADLCILLLDASRSVSSQDKKIAQIILKKEKATVVAINKWDLIQNHKNSLIEKFRRDLFFLYWAPFIPISAQKKTGLKNLFTHISKVEKQAKQRIGTGELNRLLQDSLQSYPPPIRSGKRFKIYYSAQVLPKQNTPFSPPEIVFFVNNPHLLLNSYREFLLRQIRSKWPFCGLPILLHLRGKLSQKNLNQ